MSTPETPTPTPEQIDPTGSGQHEAETAGLPVSLPEYAAAQVQNLDVPEVVPRGDAPNSLPDYVSPQAESLSSPEVMQTREAYNAAPESVKRRMEAQAAEESHLLDLVAQEVAEENLLERVRDRISRTGVEWNDAERSVLMEQIRDQGPRPEDYSQARQDISEARRITQHEADLGERLQPHFDYAAETGTIDSETLAELRNNTERVLENLMTEFIVNGTELERRHAAEVRLAQILTSGERDGELTHFGPDSAREYFAGAPLDRIKKFFRGGKASKALKAGAVVTACVVAPVIPAAYIAGEALGFGIWKIGQRGRRSRQNRQLRELAQS